MKYIASCFMCFLLCSATGQAQNLVPNGSFEDGDCPTTLAAINELDHWYFGIQLPDEDWWNWPTPDWFHSCSPGDPLQPPNLAWGFYQFPHSGEGMAGLITFNTNFSNDREVLSIELMEELVAGETYTFTLSAVNASSEVYGGSTNRLGMKLTTFPHWTSYEEAITNSAHFSIENVLADTADWSTFTAEIAADSAYKYLHIGNFYSDSATTSVFNNEEGSFIPYYFIDDVSLMKSSLNTNQFLNESTVLEAFPNPGSQHMKIISSTGILMIQVFSLNGRVVFETNLNRTKQYELNLSAWSSGVYVLKAIDGEGAIHHLKLIKN